MSISTAPLTPTDFTNRITAMGFNWQTITDEVRAQLWATVVQEQAIIAQVTLAVAMRSFAGTIALSEARIADATPHDTTAWDEMVEAFGKIADAQAALAKTPTIVNAA
jgi:hypothetical protein